MIGREEQGTNHLFIYCGRDVECEHVDFISCGRDVVTMSDLENLSSFPHLSLSGEGMSSEDNTSF